MKFLLDVGISPKLGKLLQADGHTFRYVPHHYSNKLPDSDILFGFGNCQLSDEKPSNPLAFSPLPFLLLPLQNFTPPPINFFSTFLNIKKCKVLPSLSKRAN